MATPERRVLIADDEPAARRGVRQLLSRFAGFVVVGECRNGAEVLDALDTRRPDVVFLDIQMPEVDGFEVIRRRTPEAMPLVVFLTAYDEFAVRAFEAQALDYLVKPVTDARFAETMKRVAARLDAGHARDERLLVRTSRGLALVPLRDVEWIEAEDNYARLWTRDGRSRLVRQSLGELEPRVRSLGFIRVHRQALVPVSGIRELKSVRPGGMVALLSNGVEVPVARRRRAEVSAAVRRASGARA